jgi:hypothetical protein
MRLSEQLDEKLPGVSRNSTKPPLRNLRHLWLVRGFCVSQRDICSRNVLAVLPKRIVSTHDIPYEETASN